MLCIAGFGDTGSMFVPLLGTPLADHVHISPFDLPGFGAPPLEGAETTLQALANWVNDQARETGARIILAHSVASIIASLAAQQAGSPIEIILSLEGNLTADDAYFSGTAADYDTPAAFRTAFLARLDTMATGERVIARYRSIVEAADPLALWQLGRDARQFSREHVPGDVLMPSTKAVYLYNSDNVSPASLDWLADKDLPRIVLKGASHWPSIDKPALLSEKLIEALALVS